MTLYKVIQAIAVGTELELDPTVAAPLLASGQIEAADGSHVIVQADLDAHPLLVTRGHAVGAVLTAAQWDEAQEGE